MTTIPDHALNDLSTLPAIGLGTYSLNGSEGAASIAAAIRSGYRLIDTALGYGNEDAVGEGIRRSGLDPSEILVTSKIPDGDHGHDNTKAAFARTLSNLGLEHIGVYLIHWPAPEKDLYVETWRAMIELREAGKIRTIGVSNFDERQLDRLIAETGVAPALNQVPLHVFHQQEALRKVNADRHILTQAYSPLKFGDRLRSNEILAAIAAHHGVTINQAALRWNIQLGALPIPRSRELEHQVENIDVFGFRLDDDEMIRIATIK
jgi:diketogulonate reductase-like aldo/keto reductase